MPDPRCSLDHDPLPGCAFGALVVILAVIAISVIEAARFALG